MYRGSNKITARGKGVLCQPASPMSVWVVTTFDAEFSAPGITVDKSGLIYFVDGTMIRRIDQNGVISTLLGSNDLTSARPLSCDSVMDISQVRRELRLPEPWVCILTLSPGTQPAREQFAFLFHKPFKSTLLVLGLGRTLRTQR